MALEMLSIEGPALVVATPARDRKLAGGVALACGALLLAAGEWPALVASLAFLGAGGALIAHRGLTIAFDTQARAVRLSASWLGGGHLADAVPFRDVAAIGLRQHTNGADGSEPLFLPELRLMDGRVVWLLPASAPWVECDALVEAITAATALPRRDDPRPSPWSHIG